jgi:hypothetical protein
MISRGGKDSPSGEWNARVSGLVESPSLCILYSVFCILYSMFCIMYSMYSVFCILYSMLCILYSESCILEDSPDGEWDDLPLWGRTPQCGVD